MGGYAHDETGRVARRNDMLISGPSEEEEKEEEEEEDEDEDEELERMSSWYEVESVGEVRPTARVRHTLTHVGGSSFVLVGGRSNPSNAMSDVLIGELSRKSKRRRVRWQREKRKKSLSPPSPSPSPSFAGRWSHTATYDEARSIVWVYGGRDSKQVFDEVHAMVVSHVGGGSGVNDGGEMSKEIQESVHVKTTGSSPNNGRFSHTSTLIKSMLVVVGGCSTLSGIDGGGESRKEVMSITM
jgi:hypothetical protein